jgi:hypothetical protein
MSIKAGDLIHVANQILVDRAQTAGPGQLNVPTEKIYELGNYQSVATIRDTPDLSFNLESLDVSAEIEAMLVGKDFATDAAGTEYDLATSLPLDIVSQFKKGKTDAAPFDVAGSVAIPYLAVESVAYRFGLRDNAAQTLTLRGDSIFYAAGSAYNEEFVGTNTPSQVCTLAQTALVYTDPVLGSRYALGVRLKKSGRRLRKTVDYTETATAITILAAVAATETIVITYQSATAANYPQVSHAAASATRPAAIRGKNIDVLVGGTALSNTWTSVQSVNVEYRVQLEKDEEFGNPEAVAQDYDVPAVTGSIDLKPRDVAELITKVKQIANVAGAEVVGPYTSVPLELIILLKSPDTGAVIKTLYVPDARFTLPGYSGQVQQKQTVSFPFESDGGVLKVYKGAKP